MLKGYKHSFEARLKMRATAIKNGNKPPARKGIKLTEEQKDRLRKIKNKGRYTIGHEVSEETREKQSLAKLGKPKSEQHRKHISEANIRTGKTPPRYRGIEHANWKGDSVGYGGLHSWVSRCLGTPDTCEFCGKSGLSGHSIQWANKSGNYLRELTDWLRLCAACHRKYDHGNISRNNL